MCVQLGGREVSKREASGVRIQTGAPLMSYYHYGGISQGLLMHLLVIPHIEATLCVLLEL